MIKSSISIASFYNDGQRGSSYRQMFQLFFPFFITSKIYSATFRFYPTSRFSRIFPWSSWLPFRLLFLPLGWNLAIFRRDILRTERERSSCDSSVEQISSHAYAHARPGSCQAMRRIRVANLYDKHFHRGQPVRVNTLVKKRWQTNGYRLFLPFEIGYLHCFVLVDSLLLGGRKRMTFKIIIYNTSPKLIQSTHGLMNSNRGTWHSRL